MYEHDDMKCMFLFSQSFLTISESILGKIQIITPHQRKYVSIKKKKKKPTQGVKKYVHNKYKWWRIIIKPVLSNTLSCVRPFFNFPLASLIKTGLTVFVIRCDFFIHYYVLDSSLKLKQFTMSYQVQCTMCRN